MAPIGYPTVFSSDRIYRYVLYRIWDPDLPWINFVGLNPSTADEKMDDQTIRRDIAFAKSWIFCLCQGSKLAVIGPCGSSCLTTKIGGFCKTNLFAYRSTDPKLMKKIGLSAIGPENDAWIAQIATRALIVCTVWGGDGSHLGRASQVLSTLSRPMILGLTKNGQPVHPLYQPGHLKPYPMPNKMSLDD